MALIKCTECGKEVSTQATACPHCGCPLAAVAQQTPAPSPTPDPTPPTAQKQPGKGCGGCLVACIAIFAILYIIGMFMPDAQMSESFKAGEYVGQLDGIMAYNGGRRKASDEDLDAAARRATSNVKFDTAEGRDDWIRGYKVGYSLGWDKGKQ